MVSCAGKKRKKGRHLFLNSQLCIACIAGQREGIGTVRDRHPYTILSLCAAMQAKLPSLLSSYHRKPIFLLAADYQPVDQTMLEQ
jgi:hypothetical protein